LLCGSVKQYTLVALKHSGWVYIKSRLPRTSRQTPGITPNKKEVSEDNPRYLQIEWCHLSD